MLTYQMGLTGPGCPEAQMDASCVPDPGEALWDLAEDLPLREAVPRVSLLGLLLLVSGPVGGWRFSRGECHAGRLPSEGVAVFSVTRSPGTGHICISGVVVFLLVPALASGLNRKPPRPVACP